MRKEFPRTTPESVGIPSGTIETLLDHLEEGWTDYNGNKFYVNQDGSVATGVCEIDKKTYIFDEEGNPETGWINNLGKKC